MTLKQLLETSPEFSSLTDRDVEDLQRIMCVHHYSDGYRFFKEGDEGHGIHLIINGEVSVTHKKGVERGSLEMKHLQSGSMFGIIAVISDKKQEATYTAVGPVTVATMPSSSFKLLHESNSRLGLHFQQFVVSQLAKDYRILIDLFRRALFADNEEEALAAFAPLSTTAERRHTQERRHSSH